jgi:nucleoside-diphosphate-sugar epimerase
MADFWSKKGHHVTISTEMVERLDGLERCAQQCLVLKGDDQDRLIQLIVKNEIILVTGADPKDEVGLSLARMIRHIAIESELIHRLIYLSNAVIYGDHHGLWVDETSECKIATDLGKILLQTERLYQSLEELGWHVTILRLPEIYGMGLGFKERLATLKGKPLAGRGDTYTNMIHRDDVIQGIDYVFRHHLEGIYNLADDDHPTKKEFYDHLAEVLKLPTIKWDPSHDPWHGSNKRISNHKIKAEGLLLRHPHRIIQ